MCYLFFLTVPYCYFLSTDEEIRQGCRNSQVPSPKLVRNLGFSYSKVYVLSLLPVSYIFVLRTSH